MEFFTEEKLNGMKYGDIVKLAQEFKSKINYRNGVTRKTKDFLIDFVLKAQKQLADANNAEEVPVEATLSKDRSDKKSKQIESNIEKNEDCNTLNKNEAYQNSETSVIESESKARCCRRSDKGKSRNRNEGELIEESCSNKIEADFVEKDVLANSEANGDKDLLRDDMERTNRSRERFPMGRRGRARLQLVDHDNEPVEEYEGLEDRDSLSNTGEERRNERNIAHASSYRIRQSSGRRGESGNGSEFLEDTELRRNEERFSRNRRRSRYEREELDEYRRRDEEKQLSDRYGEDYREESDRYDNERRNYSDDYDFERSEDRYEREYRRRGERIARRESEESGVYDGIGGREERYGRSSERYRDEYAEEDYEETPEEKRTEVFASGILDINSDGNGVLLGTSCKPSSNDIFVSAQIIKNFSLRIGDLVTGIVRSQKRGDCYSSLNTIVYVNGLEPNKAKCRPMFDQLVPIFPNERYTLEHSSEELSTRIIDIFSPLGKGQRCLIVAPPKAGKTIMLKNIAKGIAKNFPEAILFALLVDERPEEVTDMERSINGEVIASTFDEPFEQHIRISNLVMERARRLVELGKDVVIVMDSLTRLGRACNNGAPSSGRTMTGGLDISALRVPKHLFGSARNIENGGSLTIIATALVETGSKMDEVIFEEFKGTGNMEIDLSRRLAERRVFPAIDLRKSGTRHDELLLDRKVLWLATQVRQKLDSGTSSENEHEQVEAVIKAITPHKSNEEFVAHLCSTAMATNKG